LPPGKGLPLGCDEGVKVVDAADREALGLEYACGDVAVNLVASAAERDMPGVVFEKQLTGELWMFSDVVVVAVNHVD
jgi:hypothetical protein